MGAGGRVDDGAAAAFRRGVGEPISSALRGRNRGDRASSTRSFASVIVRPNERGNFLFSLGRDEAFAEKGALTGRRTA